jgi:hypothetical protein
MKSRISLVLVAMNVREIRKENRIMRNTITKRLHQSAALFVAAIIVAATLTTTALAHEIDQTSRVIWPDIIPIPAGFEPEGIEMGRDQDFFVGTTSFSGNLANTGAIYKGNLVTGEGRVLVSPTGKPLIGLSYDARTDYLYAATGFWVGSSSWEQGIKVYTGTSGRLLEEVIFGDDMLINDVLVTDTAVYCTDSFNPVLYKMPLENDGRVFSSTVERIEMTGFEMDHNGPFPINANGLAGDSDGKVLVVTNSTTGVLSRVDTTSGIASRVQIHGHEPLFLNTDGLYMEGRTLYILQSWSPTQMIAVVELSGDLSQGTFIKNLVSNDFAVPSTITGFGNCIYAINTHFFELIAEGGDPTLVQSEVVKLYK